ncbi:hypothetical protein NEOLEDRAFT_726273 [Neolentinus lepideus HHB14362 ss-1]|uniref:Uncharacterized protein n=1 Tax=Neolentinus lepideus HHB14362 ss-1 TaxID=1314782 RepID=A0A165Q0H3_9AGAM|nr:hypothetical protein NEOLEDRAFT_726273 [Neolentinus lepideus HHB14362 ss-1]
MCFPSFDDPMLTNSTTLANHAPGWDLPQYAYMPNGPGIMTVFVRLGCHFADIAVRTPAAQVLAAFNLRMMRDESGHEVDCTERHLCCRQCHKPDNRVPDSCGCEDSHYFFE